VAIYLDGRNSPDRADDGTPLLDDDFLVLVNSWWERLDFVVPETRPEQRWCVEFDTFDLDAQSEQEELSAGRRRTIAPRSLVVLRATS
jgi:glycogen operon protein